MDQARFEAACAAARERTAGLAGIGTLGERTLHAVVKHYIEANPDWHEQKLGRYTVDVFTGDRIFEIQTRHFGKLSPKLAALLPDYPVTVVYPLAARKWLFWVDPQSGEVSARRLSPRRGRWLDMMPELYRIKPYLANTNLSIRVILVDLEEYRLLNGWSRDRKKGSWRNDRIPLGLAGELLLTSPADYRQLLPDSLVDAFTSADLAKAAGVSIRLSQTTLNILGALGVVETCGRRGRSRLFRAAAQPDGQTTSEPVGMQAE
jgi:hypothetical protein